MTNWFYQLPAWLPGVFSWSEAPVQQGGHPRSRLSGQAGDAQVRKAVGMPGLSLVRHLQRQASPQEQQI